MEWDEASCQDGFTMALFQDCWRVVKEDIISGCFFKSSVGLVCSRILCKCPLKIVYAHAFFCLLFIRKHMVRDSLLLIGLHVLKQKPSRPKRIIIMNNSLDIS
jgi:hypothetical protein